MPSRSSLNQRVEILTGFYKTLRTNGFDIKDNSSLSLKHAKALLDIWQAQGKASNTTYAQWSDLRSWSRVLGKDGMIGPVTDYQDGFQRHAPAGSSNGYIVLDKSQLQTRSAFLSTKPDLTPYLVDRLTRELDITREMALELDIETVREVIEREASVLRVGVGNQRKVILHVRLHLELLVEVLEFMVSRNRKTLAWTGLDLDAAIHKYALRTAYVNRTIFPKNKVATPHQKEGGAA